MNSEGESISVPVLGRADGDSRPSESQPQLRSEDLFSDIASDGLLVREFGGGLLLGGQASGASTNESTQGLFVENHDGDGLIFDATAFVGGPTVLELMPDFENGGGDVIELAMLFDKPTPEILSQAIVGHVAAGADAAVVPYLGADGGLKILYDDELAQSCTPTP